jgi:hypothetical protein
VETIFTFKDRKRARKIASDPNTTSKFGSYLTGNKTHVCKKKLNQLIIFRAVVTIYSEQHQTLTNILSGRNLELLTVM